MPNRNKTQPGIPQFFKERRSIGKIAVDEWLKKDKNKSGLTGELVGYSSDGRAIFVLQIEKFSIRNRLTSAGEPTAIDEDYLNASQVRALIAGDFQNPLEYQFSENGVNDWHTVQTTADHYLRQRIANLNSEWSSAILLAPGQQGAPGTNGADGQTPKRGVDYWTAADVATIENYINQQIGPLADLLDEINGEVI